MKHIILITVIALVGWFFLKSTPEIEETDDTETTEETQVEVKDSEVMMENDKTANTEAMEEKDNTEIMEADKDKNFNLSGKSLGNGKVFFEWKLPEDIQTDDNKGFILVRSVEENPIHDGLNYWFRQYSGNREATWVDVPSGTYHFRICALQNEECEIYSNDVKLEVK